VALSALMRIPRERMAWLGAEALRRITEAPLTEQQKYLLGECIQAYLPLDDEQQQEFQKLVAGESYRGVQAMSITWFEQGLEKGIEKGIEKGYREVIREQLEERFGPLPSAVLERLQQLPVERLPALARALLRAQSLRELGLDE
jgi:flagellar biosynthesis/type III secretory pathway protein FliH